MFQTTVGTHRLDGDDLELTQQFPPIFQALLSSELKRGPGGGGAPGEDDFHRDPLAAPLPTQLSASPAETTTPPSSLDVALTSALPAGTRSVPATPAAEPARLRAVPTGGAHRPEVRRAESGRVEAHADTAPGSRSGRRAAKAGAHRAPESEPQLSADRPAVNRGGRHRTLRAVVH